MNNMCEKEFSDSNFELSTYWQNIDFSGNCPKFHLFTKIVIFQVKLEFIRPTASTLKISGQ